MVSWQQSLVSTAEPGNGWRHHLTSALGYLTSFTTPPCILIWLKCLKKHHSYCDFTGFWVNIGKILTRFSCKPKEDTIWTCLSSPLDQEMAVKSNTALMKGRFESAKHCQQLYRMIPGIVSFSVTTNRAVISIDQLPVIIALRCHRKQISSWKSPQGERCSLVAGCVNPLYHRQGYG